MDHNLPVRAEQLRARLAVYPVTVIAQMFLQPLFVWLFWEHASHRFLILWLLCIYSLHLAELAFWRANREKTNTIQECRRWNSLFTFFSLAVGLLWGAASVLFFPADLAYQALMICVMLGLAAGAITLNPVHPPTLYLYPPAVLLPIMFRVAAEGDSTHWALAAMLFFFMLVVLNAGRQLSWTFWLSLTQRFENKTLVEQLTEQKWIVEEAHRKLENANEQLRSHGQLLETRIQERTAEVLHKTRENLLVKDATIHAMCSLAETRNNETGAHLKRTGGYVRELAIRLREHKGFREVLTDENIELLPKVASLHDIGKVGIPDSILLKPGKLSVDEFEVMKTHTTLGGNAIMAAEAMLPVQNNFLFFARQVVMWHHEKWDGSGYPSGLAGDEIPIPARLMAVADVYDALISRRIYKEPHAHAQAVEIIFTSSGSHFDPDVVDAFLSIKDKFQQIAQTYRD